MSAASLGIVIASKIATTRNPAINNDNNNLKLNACLLLMTSSGATKALLKSLTFLCHFFCMIAKLIKLLLIVLCMLLIR